MGKAAAAASRSGASGGSAKPDSAAVRPCARRRAGHGRQPRRLRSAAASRVRRTPHARPSRALLRSREKWRKGASSPVGGACGANQAQGLQDPAGQREYAYSEKQSKGRRSWRKIIDLRHVGSCRLPARRLPPTQGAQTRRPAAPSCRATSGRRSLGRVPTSCTNKSCWRIIKTQAENFRNLGITRRYQRGAGRRGAGEGKGAEGGGQPAAGQDAALQREREDPGVPAPLTPVPARNTQAPACAPGRAPEEMRTMPHSERPPLPPAAAATLPPPLPPPQPTGTRACSGGRGESLEPKLGPGAARAEAPPASPLCGRARMWARGHLLARSVLWPGLLFCGCFVAGWG